MNFRPPLASELFDNSGRFNEFLHDFPGAEFLARDLSPLLARGEIGLEEQLRHYAEHPEERMRQRYKHIPGYLRDLIWACSEQYVRMPGCYVQLVIALLAEVPHEVLFLVLNYDTLLEKAIVAYEPAWQFSKLADYVEPSRAAKVVKLHGSVNWFIRLGGLGEWEVHVEKEDVLRKPDEDQIIVGRFPHVKQAEHAGRRLYPVLTAPLAGKGITDIVCPDSHSTFAREFLASCQKMLVIGTSGLDADLLALLDSSMSPDSGTMIHFVGQGPQTVEALARFRAGVASFREYPLTTSYDNGFQRYVADETFRQFAHAGI